MKNLESVKNAINTFYDEACDALKTDLGRSRTEASGELQAVLVRKDTFQLVVLIHTFHFQNKLNCVNL